VFAWKQNLERLVIVSIWNALKAKHAIGKLVSVNPIAVKIPIVLKVSFALLSLSFALLNFNVKPMQIA
jgi:hypothetical protein